jgi:hypothetical protein
MARANRSLRSQIDTRLKHIKKRVDEATGKRGSVPKYLKGNLFYRALAAESAVEDAEALLRNLKKVEASLRRHR